MARLAMQRLRVGIRSAAFVRLQDARRALRFEAAEPVVDSLDAERIECALDVGGWPLFPGVSDRMKTTCAGSIE